MGEARWGDSENGGNGEWTKAELRNGRTGEGRQGEREKGRTGEWGDNRIGEPESGRKTRIEAGVDITESVSRTKRGTIFRFGLS